MPFESTVDFCSQVAGQKTLSYLTMLQEWCKSRITTPAVLSALALLFCALVTVPAHAQERVIFDEVLSAQRNSIDFPVNNVRQGDYVRVEVTFFTNAGSHDCNGTAFIEGRTLSATFGRTFNSTEFFSNGNPMLLQCRHTCNHPPATTTRSRVRLLVGSPNLTLNNWVISNTTHEIVCNYSIGSVPWDPRGQNVGITLFWQFVDGTTQDFAYKSGLASGLGNRNFSGQVLFAIKDLPFAPYGARKIGAKIDPNNAISESNEGDNTYIANWSMVEQIPNIQERLPKPAIKAAQLQRLWMSQGEAVATLPFSVALAEAERGKLSLDATFTVDWILDPANVANNRTKSSYETLLKNVDDPTPMSKLKDRVKERLTGFRDKTISFGNLDTFGTKLFVQFTALAHVSESYNGWVALDNVQQCLGAFAFYGVPVGTAYKDKNGKITGTITHVGVFAGDVFEFSDEGWLPQSLGFWRILPPDISKLGGPGYEQVGNFTYNNYREFTGRGRDVVIMTPAKRIPLSKPIPFSIP